MKLETMRVRRSRPSALSAALALMLTMLCVYLISLSAAPEKEASPAIQSAATQTQLRMNALDISFECDGRYTSHLDARVAAAKCVQSGGAGLILPEGEGYAVIRRVSSTSAGENLLRRSANGLTLQITGSASDMSAIASAIDFLHGLTSETASLSRMLEDETVTAATMETLLRLYRAQGEKVCTALAALQSDSALTRQLHAACLSALDRLDTREAPSPERVELIHAGACADWIFLLNEFTASAE